MTSTSTEPSAILGRNIRAEMVRKGVSQEALAHRLQKSQAAVSKRLRGETPLSVDDLATIAQHLGVAMSVLLDGIDA